MSVSGNEVALASVLITGVIGGSTVVASWRDRIQNKKIRSEDRTHERQLKRDSETFPFRQQAYQDMLTFFEAWNLWMEWTEPLWSEHDPEELKKALLPPLPTPAEQVDMLARLALFASSEVYDLAKAQTVRINAFDAAVKMLRSMRSQRAESADDWERVRRRREETRSHHDEMAAVMRAELATP